MGGRQVHSEQYRQWELSGEEAGSGVGEMEEMLNKPVRTRRT